MCKDGHVEHLNLDKAFLVWFNITRVVTLNQLNLLWLVDVSLSSTVIGCTKSTRYNHDLLTDGDWRPLIPRQVNGDPLLLTNINCSDHLFIKLVND